MKKLFLTIYCIIIVAFAVKLKAEYLGHEYTSTYNNSHNKSSISLSNNVRLGKLQVLNTTNNKIVEKSNYNMSNNLTYFYNINTAFSIGARLGINYAINFHNYNSNDDIITGEFSSLLLYMNKLTIYRSNRWSSSILGGLGASFHKATLLTSNRDNITNSAIKPAFSYNVGLLESYDIANFLGVGLNINYTNLGSPRFQNLKLKNDRTIGLSLTLTMYIN